MARADQRYGDAYGFANSARRRLDRSGAYTNVAVNEQTGGDGLVVPSPPAERCVP